MEIASLIRTPAKTPADVPRLILKLEEKIKENFDLSKRELQIEKDKQETAIKTKRQSLVGSGDRSERIRTYNFPQGRITDHRINLTLYKLEQVLEGDLIEIIDPLTQEYQAELLLELENEG